MQPVIVRAVQTGEACPSQWDGWDDSGSYWYLRYRYGLGQARQYASGPDWYRTYDPGQPEVPVRVLDFSYGHPLDGVITLEKVAELAGLVLSPELQTS
jgi:hypothetical protein